MIKSVLTILSLGLFAPHANAAIVKAEYFGIIDAVEDDLNYFSGLTLLGSSYVATFVYDTDHPSRTLTDQGSHVVDNITGSNYVVGDTSPIIAAYFTVDGTTWSAGNEFWARTGFVQTRDRVPEYSPLFDADMIESRETSSYNFDGPQIANQFFYLMRIRASANIFLPSPFGLETELAEEPVFPLNNLPESMASFSLTETNYRGAQGVETRSASFAGGVSRVEVSIMEEQPATIPLPAAAPLLLAGVGALAFASRRRKR